MELRDIIKKVGKDKFKAALEADDKAALDKLLDEAGVTLSDEQLDYIAGGFGGFGGDNDPACHTAEPNSICA
ncbi:MAG: hypothetical protein E7000_03830 [Coriobacteriaceae bacterium]|nr:hypothetical protein [Coriobacteriaceae bacterium]